MQLKTLVMFSNGALACRPKQKKPRFVIYVVRKSYLLALAGNMCANCYMGSPEWGPKKKKQRSMLLAIKIPSLRAKEGKQHLYINICIT